MANDRIYLRYVFCGECQMLWKFYPFSGVFEPEDESYGQYPAGIQPDENYADVYPVQVFIRRHLLKCHPRSGCMHLRGVPGFEVITESPNDKTGILDAVAKAITQAEAEERLKELEQKENDDG